MSYPNVRPVLGIYRSPGQNPWYSNDPTRNLEKAVNVQKVSMWPQTDQVARSKEKFTKPRRSTYLLHQHCTKCTTIPLASQTAARPFLFRYLPVKHCLKVTRYLSPGIPTCKGLARDVCLFMLVHSASCEGVSHQSRSSDLQISTALQLRSWPVPWARSHDLCSPRAIP